MCVTRGEGSEGFVCSNAAAETRHQGSELHLQSACSQTAVVWGGAVYCALVQCFTPKATAPPQCII